MWDFADRGGLKGCCLSYPEEDWEEGKVRKGEIVLDVSVKDLWATTPEHLSKERLRHDSNRKKSLAGLGRF